MLTLAGKDQLTSASNTVLSGINVVIAAETVLISPTKQRVASESQRGCADVCVPEPRTTVEALVGGSSICSRNGCIFANWNGKYVVESMV
jgi:hypothetical protein